VTQKYRTTCFADEIIHYEHSLEDTPEWKEEVLGFRLARGPAAPSSTLMRRGSMYYDVPEDADPPVSRPTVAVANRPSIGFRLARKQEGP
jgi:hypothetical protein